VADHVRVTIPPLMVPVGGTYFPAHYLNFLRDLTKLPWPRVPDTAVRAAVKMAAERKRRQGR